MLKMADQGDISDLKRMCLQFKENSPYRDQTVDETKIEEVLLGLITGDNTKGIVLVAVEDFKSVGMLLGMAAEFMFSRDKYATELAWWVDKEHRGTHGRELQEAFVFWAKKVGCKYQSMSLLANKDATKMKKLYKQLGFKQMESAWLKELN